MIRQLNIFEEHEKQNVKEFAKKLGHGIEYTIYKGKQFITIPKYTKKGLPHKRDRVYIPCKNEEHLFITFGILYRLYNSGYFIDTKNSRLIRNICLSILR